MLWVHLWLVFCGLSGGIASPIPIRGRIRSLDGTQLEREDTLKSDLQEYSRDYAQFIAARASDDNNKAILQGTATNRFTETLVSHYSEKQYAEAVPALIGHLASPDYDVTNKDLGNARYLYSSNRVGAAIKVLYNLVGDDLTKALSNDLSLILESGIQADELRILKFMDIVTASADDTSFALDAILASLTKN